jgi:hypothetical protein
VTAVYEVRWQHPIECEPCGSIGWVKFSRVGYADTGGGVTPEVSRLSSVIPCPHCRSGQMLERLVAREAPAWTPDGVA